MEFSKNKSESKCLIEDFRQKSRNVTRSPSVIEGHFKHSKHSKHSSSAKKCHNSNKESKYLSKQSHNDKLIILENVDDPKNCLKIKITKNKEEKDKEKEKIRHSSKISDDSKTEKTRKHSKRSKSKVQKYEKKIQNIPSRIPSPQSIPDEDKNVPIESLVSTTNPENFISNQADQGTGTGGQDIGSVIISEENNNIENLIQHYNPTSLNAENCFENITASQMEYNPLDPNSIQSHAEASPKLFLESKEDPYLSFESIKHKELPKTSPNSIQSWLVNTTGISTNSILNPTSKILYKIKILDHNDEIILPIDFNTISIDVDPNECEDVTLNEERQREYFSTDEKNFMLWKLAEGWSLRPLQEIVKMSRVLGNNNKIDELSKETPQTKKPKLSEVVAPSTVASYGGCENIDANANIAAIPAAVPVNHYTTTNAEEICSQKALSNILCDDSLKPIIKSNMDLEKAKDVALEWVLRNFDSIGEESNEIDKGITSESIGQQQQQQALVPFTITSTKDDAFIVSNQVTAQAQSNRTEHFIKRSQTLAAGPIMENVFNDLNDPMTTNLSAASLHVQMQFRAPPAQSQLLIDSKNSYTPCKIAVVHIMHPIQTLNETYMQEIKRSLLEEVDHAEGINDNLGFLGCNQKDGGLILICNNYETKKWVFRVIDSMKSFPKGALKIVEENFLDGYLCFTRISADDIMQFSQLLLRLEKQNAGLSTKCWQLIKKVHLQNGSENLLFLIDELSKEKILNQNGRLFLNFGQISIKIKDKAFKTDPLMTLSSHQINYDGINPLMNSSCNSMEILASRTQMLRTFPENSSSSGKITESNNREMEMENMLNRENGNNMTNALQSATARWLPDSRNVLKNNAKDDHQNFTGLNNMNNINPTTSLMSGSSIQANTYFDGNNRSEFLTTQNMSRNKVSCSIQPGGVINNNWNMNRDTENGMFSNNFLQNTTFNNRSSNVGPKSDNQFVGNQRLNPNNLGDLGFTPMTTYAQSNPNSMNWF